MGEIGPDFLDCGLHCIESESLRPIKSAALPAVKTMGKQALFLSISK